MFQKEFKVPSQSVFQNVGALGNQPGDEASLDIEYIIAMGQQVYKYKNIWQFSTDKTGAYMVGVHWRKHEAALHQLVGMYTQKCVLHALVYIIRFWLLG